MSAVSAEVVAVLLYDVADHCRPDGTGWAALDDFYRAARLADACREDLDLADVTRDEAWQRRDDLLGHLLVDLGVNSA